jgi:hypothetical protein
MPPKSRTEEILQVLLIILSLIAIVLIECSPDTFTAAKVVYQGF